MFCNIPVYWTKLRKRLPDKTTLLSLNWYRNAHYTDQNNMKKDVAELISKQLANHEKVTGRYTLSIAFFYKNPACDGSNVVPVLEKVFLDEAQNLGVVEQDSVRFHVGTSWSVSGKDVKNPRVEITIHPAN